MTKTELLAKLAEIQTQITTKTFKGEFQTIIDKLYTDLYSEISKLDEAGTTKFDVIIPTLITEVTQAAAECATSPASITTLVTDFSKLLTPEEPAASADIKVQADVPQKDVPINLPTTTTATPLLATDPHKLLVDMAKIHKGEISKQAYEAKQVTIKASQLVAETLKTLNKATAEYNDALKDQQEACEEKDEAFSRYSAAIKDHTIATERQAEVLQQELDYQHNKNALCAQFMDGMSKSFSEVFNTSADLSAVNKPGSDLSENPSRTEWELMDELVEATNPSTTTHELVGEDSLMDV